MYRLATHKQTTDSTESHTTHILRLKLINKLAPDSVIPIALVAIWTYNFFALIQVDMMGVFKIFHKIYYFTRLYWTVTTTARCVGLNSVCFGLGLEWLKQLAPGLGLDLDLKLAEIRLDFDLWAAGLGLGLDLSNAGLAAALTSMTFVQLMTFEMRCYRRILHIRWQQMTTKEDVRRRMKCQRYVLQMVIERKLNLFGHICRMNNSRLIKQVVLGMVDRSGIRGRPN